jgi:hypothetical protein
MTFYGVTEFSIQDDNDFELPFRVEHHVNQRIYFPKPFFTSFEPSCKMNPYFT